MLNAEVEIDHKYENIHIGLYSSIHYKTANEVPVARCNISWQYLLLGCCNSWSKWIQKEKLTSWRRWWLWYASVHWSAGTGSRTVWHLDLPGGLEHCAAKQDKNTFSNNPFNKMTLVPGVPNMHSLIHTYKTTTMMLWQLTAWQR